MQYLGPSAKLEEYEAQARDLARGHAAGDSTALEIIHHHDPRFLDTEVRWLPLRISKEDIGAAPFTLDDARLVLARRYSFAHWDALADLVVEIHAGGPVANFEFAAEAVITGDIERLRTLLTPDLVKARSSRVTHHDPPRHRATLLHYIAANGVEGYRQRSPANAVDVARTLLDAGSDPDALADMYGEPCTTLSMLVSSSPPVDSGVQIPLVETLLDYGADIDGNSRGKWSSPIRTALAFGFLETAQVLARRGARVDRLDVAAGLGQRDAAIALLPAADPVERHRAFALAAQLGHAEMVRILLDAGENPDRYNPEGLHAHSTPLHQAALAGHLPVVQLLVERGARLDMPDKLYKATPLGWAEYAGQREVAALLAP